MSAAEPRIRLLTPSDAGALARFFEAIKDDPGVNRFFMPFPFTPEQAAEITGRDPSLRDLYFGAFEDDEIVGLGMLRGLDEGYETPAFGVGVAPSARGRGVVSALLDWAVASARAAEIPGIVLKVSDDNLRARRLYEDRGFTFSGERAENGQLIGRLSLR
ncbi:MAG: GNAT family N-acetyltransferase [Coriobacteriales bacterium]|nr:GNAT family N-acetyltransferase [Coriobacteriales bacterium]